MFAIFSITTKSIFRPFLTISGFALAVITYGCTSQQIQYQALAHNQAFSASADQILLTNIVRSSRVMPVDYTSITEYQAKEVASGSIVGKIPFGADALRIFASDPSINVGPGIASLSLKDFAQQKESFARLYEDVEIQNFTNLRSAGWEEQLIPTMLFQSIRIRGVFARELIKRSKEICAEVKAKNGYSPQCKMIDEAMSCVHLGRTIGETYDGFLAQLRIEDDPVFPGWIVNRGDRKCEFLDFQSLLARFRLLSIRFDSETTKKITLSFHKETKEYPATIKKVYEDAKDALSGRSAAPFEITVRSTNLMVNFLGQLARAQLIATGEENWVPAIYSEYGKKKTPLFIVETGHLSGAAISVEIEGQTYSIPTVYDDTYDKSLYLFRFVRTRLDQAYAQAKLPPSNTLILR